MSEALLIFIYMVINLISGVIAMTVHELPKAIAAHFLTHPLHRPTKIKLPSLFRYVDPIGLLLLTVSSGLRSMGIGWQKPYEYNPNKLIDKHRSLLPIMLVGQLSSIIVVLLLYPVYNGLVGLELHYSITYFVASLIRINFVIFVVNLLPVPPLDMGYIVFAYSPNSYFKLVQNQRYIHSAFILVVAMGIIENISAVFFRIIQQIFI